MAAASENAKEVLKSVWEEQGDPALTLDDWVVASPEAVTADVGVFWMGKDGFFTENGFVQPLDCTVRDSVFTALNRTYAHRVWGYHNATYGEVTWFYPTTTAECTNYVTYNYRDNTWVTGTLARTAGVGEKIGRAHV